MDTRTTLAAAALIAGFGCSQRAEPSDGPDPDPVPLPVPVDVDSAHVMLTFSPAGSAMNNYTETFSGPLALHIASNGDVTGSLAILPSTGFLGPALPQALLSGRFTGGRLTLDPGQLAFSPGVLVTWDSFTLSVGPAGLIEGGAGTLTGTWQLINTDVIDDGRYNVKLLAAPDTQGSSIAQVYTDPASFSPVLPTDVLSLQLGEPADAVQAATLQVRANGVALAGSLIPVAPVDGLVTVVTFQPTGFWPFGSEITIDLHGLTDPSNNAFTPPAVRSASVADPGPITANLGFESALLGWSVRDGGFSGTVSGVGPSFGTIDPVEGASQLVVSDNAIAEGYFDVAADATSLSVSVALLLGQGDFGDDRFAVVSLRRATGERVVIYDAAVEHVRSTPCDCGEDLIARVAPTTKAVDLTPYRGERLFLVAQTKTYQGFFRAPLALALDDLRIR
jgi:hypothetical protein